MTTSTCVCSPRLGQPILATSSSSAPTAGLFSLESPGEQREERVSAGVTVHRFYSTTVDPVKGPGLFCAAAEDAGLRSVFSIM